MSDDKPVMNPQLWTARPVEDTIAIYSDWAATYDADIKARGYQTPTRIADALTDAANPTDMILDFGCGTGLAGMALHRNGFKKLHGTDITAEMLAKAEASGTYQKVWLGDAGAMTFSRGEYDVIVAAGVISLGAGPASLLDQLMAKLATGGLLAFSYNGPTLEDAEYTDALGAVCASGIAEVIFRENGPHLTDVGMTSDVIILRRR